MIKSRPSMLYNGSISRKSAVLDEYFRRFSGHTQVNATDLRLMKYPNRDMLISLGRWASRQGELTQEEIDSRIRELGIVSRLIQWK